MYWYFHSQDLSLPFYSRQDVKYQDSLSIILLYTFSTQFFWVQNPETQRGQGM